MSRGTMGRTTRTAAAVTVALATAACSGSSTEDTTADDPATEAPTAQADDAQPAGDAEAQAEAETEEAPPRVPYDDVAAMTLTTPAAGQGPWPELAWEPVDGAERYRVTVYAEDGTGWWAWEGADTAVILGGFEQAPDAPDTPLGPRLDGPVTWDVLAVDADGAVVGQSGERPLAP